MVGAVAGAIIYVSSTIVINAIGIPASSTPSKPSASTKHILDDETTEEPPRNVAEFRADRKLRTKSGKRLKLSREERLRESILREMSVQDHSRYHNGRADPGTRRLTNQTILEEDDSSSDIS